MSRSLIHMFMGFVVLNAVIVAGTIVWSDAANSSTGSQIAAERGDFDYVFAAATAASPGNHAPAATTMVDFDQTFTSVSVPRREDTPPNRERLRNLGWKRILGTN